MHPITQPHLRLFACLLGLAAASCGAATSLPTPDATEDDPINRGATIDVTAPDGVSHSYLVFEDELECESFPDGAYWIHFASNDLVTSIKFLPYEEPGEFLSDNVVATADMFLPRCEGPCAEVDISDGTVVLTSGVNASCSVAATVTRRSMAVSFECVGITQTNGKTASASGELGCVVTAGKEPQPT